MSYGYQPKFDPLALAAFRSLDPWVQEWVLDEIETLLGSVVPSVAERLHPSETVHSAARTIGEVEHLVFLLTTLNVGARVLRIQRVGHSARP